VVRGTAQINPYRWTYSVRLLANQIDRATWRNTLMYRFSDDLQLGLEYNPLADDLGIIGNYRLQRETAHRPAVILGTSSDRIGTPFGRAYYATVAKDLTTVNGWRFAPYVGLMWSEFDHKFRVPFGASIPLGKGYSLLPSFDGHAFHTMASYSWKTYSVTGILVRSRDPGFAVTVGF
jgi:hypothetical protein